MMASLSLANLAHKYGGVLIEPDCHLQSLSIDSRTLDSGQAFVALKGDHFDGHEYLQTALDQGASALVTERVLPQKAPQWIVKNSTRALGHIGAENRRLFAGKLIALTGSNGKTTVKEMLAAILRLSGEVMATKGNLNNHIGVPLTLLTLSPKHQYAVVEMGASGLGEIHYLTHLAQPDVALVNNVGDAHVGEFGSVKNIEIGKGEIFNGLSSAGTGVVNLDSPGAERYMDKLIGRKMLTFGVAADQANIRAENIQLSEQSLSFRLCVDARVLDRASGQAAGQQHRDVSLSVTGEHNVHNALAATACCLAVGVPLDQVVQGLALFSGVAGRLQQHQLVNGALIIDDSYNASPSSVKAAINTLTQMGGQSILVLGDMAELGEEAAQLHFDVGVYAKEWGIDQLLAVGELSALAAEGFGAAAHSFQDKQEASAFLLKQPLSVDTKILVKGSRSSRMEDVVNSIIKTKSES